MADPVAGARAAKELLERDERLRKKIFLHAYSLTRKVADANELAQDGIARAIDPPRLPGTRTSSRTCSFTSEA
jgi:DNA-directed RNA polymerase specialized sigma24 family protein